VKTRCPHCQTEYDVDPDILRQAHGMARCYNCGEIFDAFANAEGRSARKPAPVPELIEADLPDPDENNTPPPFELPDDVPPLQVSGDAALDASDSLGPRRRKRSPWWLKLLALLLLLGLLAQVAWWQRAEWVGIAQLQPLTGPLCQRLDCKLPTRRAPQSFGVIERRLELSRKQAHALHLLLRLRNEADFAQPLPQLSLSLLDINGTLLARRHLRPADYLFPAPPPDYLVQPGEVFTVDLLLEDPGQRATGFSFDLR
jgi:predicted Zn finger-like uncharacterized protein